MRSLSTLVLLWVLCPGLASAQCEQAQPCDEASTAEAPLPPPSAEPAAEPAEPSASAELGAPEPAAEAELGAPVAAFDWPALPDDVSATQALNPRWDDTGFDDGFIVAGSLVLIASYLLAAIPIPYVWAGARRAFFDDALDVPHWWTAFIPLMPYLTQLESTSSPFLFSLPSSIGQGLGFTLLLVGLFAHVDEVHVGQATLRLSGCAPSGADLGGGLELTF